MKDKYLFSLIFKLVLIETIMKLNQLKVSNTNDFLQKINQLLVKFSNENSISLILQKNNIVFENRL